MPTYTGLSRDSVGEPESFLLSEERRRLPLDLRVTGSVLGTDGRVRSCVWRATDRENVHNPSLYFCPVSGGRTHFEGYFPIHVIVAGAF